MPNTAVALLQIIESSDNDAVRQLAALLFRRHCYSMVGHFNFWSDCDEQTRVSFLSLTRAPRLLCFFFCVCVCVCVCVCLCNSWWEFPSNCVCFHPAFFHLSTFSSLLRVCVCVNRTGSRPSSWRLSQTGKLQGWQFRA